MRPEGPCQGAIDFLDEYNSQEFISHALCCHPEWPIGAVGLSLSGCLGLYGTYQIYQSNGNLKMNRSNAKRNGKVSRTFPTFCVAFMSLGLVLASIISLQINFIVHLIVAPMYFIGGVVLMFIRIPRFVPSCKRSFTRKIQSPHDCVICLSILFDLLSMLSAFLSAIFLLIFMHTSAGIVPAESMLALVSVFAHYSFLSDLIADQIKVDTSSGEILDHEQMQSTDEYRHINS